jgi:membrane fusion protein, type I secretion system
VQHLDGSIIKELRVKEGDRLATGDVLVVLDDTQTRAVAEPSANQHRPALELTFLHGLKDSDLGQGLMLRHRSDQAERTPFRGP